VQLISVSHIKETAEISVTVRNVVAVWCLLTGFNCCSHNNFVLLSVTDGYEFAVLPRLTCFVVCKQNCSKVTD